MFGVSGNPRRKATARTDAWSSSVRVGCQTPGWRRRKQRFVSRNAILAPHQGWRNRLAKRRRLALWAASWQSSASGWGSGRSLNPLESLTDTLIELVDKLVQANKQPLLSTTPISFALGELAARTEALENAVREIALEVQKLSAQG